MIGKIKKLKDSNESYVYPVTVSSAVYVNGTQTLKNYLENLPEATKSSASGAGYLIDLDKWGITNGIPSKPYIDSHYIMANDNITGINNAIQYASDNNYTKVVLPRGEYALCFPQQIQIKSNLDLNLNGSTLKVIYDSDKKSPFDMRTTTDYYDFQGISFIFNNVVNSSILNGTIIGDRVDRSYANLEAEKRVEGSYGVVFRKSTKNCQVKNCIISDYMGDSVSFHSTSVYELAEFNAGFTLNNLDSNGQIIPSSNTLTTLPFPLPTGYDYTSFMVYGSGYTRLTNLNTKEFDVYFYRADNVFIGASKNRRVLVPITFPVNTAKFRIVLRDETNPSRNILWRLKFGDIPSFNVVENCEIFGCQRGGITGGGSYNIIRNNNIRDTGLGSNWFINGKPVFFDPTKYGFNQEDDYGDGVIIENNRFSGCHNAILAGVYSLDISKNHFFNIESNAINLYITEMVSIKDNYFHDCGNNIGLMDAGFKNNSVNIEGNHFNGGTFQLQGKSYKVFVEKNTFTNLSYITSSDDSHCIFRNNFIYYTKVMPAIPTIILDTLEGTSFESLTRQPIKFNTYKFKSCKFNSVVIQASTRNTLTKTEDVEMVDCEFNKSDIDSPVSLNFPRNINVKDSKLNDSPISPTIVNLDVHKSNFTFTNCTLLTKENTSFIKTSNNSGSVEVKLIGCKLEITNPSFLYIHDYSSYKNSSITISIKKSSIRYSGDPTPLSLQYYRTVGYIKKFISVDNKFFNINLPIEDEGVFQGYDETKSIGIPTSGYHDFGSLISNANPTIGANLGWVCLSRGYAETESWSASKIYHQNDKIVVGNRVFEAQNSGTTAKTIPVFPSTPWGEVYDNEGRTSWAPSKSYTVGDTVLPKTPNGYFYVCSTSGISGTSEPANWTTIETLATSSGTASFRAKAIITWKEVGAKAVFGTYGLIN